jgi:hypothetical protein
MNPIGGYFELELRKSEEYHKDAIRLNTGRNALELILRTRKFSKVYIPYYTCDVILEPFIKTKTQYEFYSIDNNFEPIFDYSLIKGDISFLFTNYFGLKDVFIKKLSKKCKNLIIDNSQAFFSKPIDITDTIYSCRKFFGVPDGAYLYLDKIDFEGFPQDISIDRFFHLIKRFEYGAEEGYSDFKKNEENLIGQPIKKMSKLTQSLMCNIDYEFIRKKRIENFKYLHDNLFNINELDFDLANTSVPMLYPFLSNILDLKQKFIEKKIFVATYWPNVLEWTKKDSLEYKYTTQIIHLPIDQRYGINEIEYILSIIKGLI